MRPGLSSDQKAELRELRRTNEILWKASAYFAQGQRCLPTWVIDAPPEPSAPRPTNFSHMRVGSTSTGVLLPRMSLLNSDYGGPLLTSAGLQLPLPDPHTPPSFSKSLISEEPTKHTPGIRYLRQAAGSAEETVRQLVGRDGKPDDGFPVIPFRADRSRPHKDPTKVAAVVVFDPDLVTDMATYDVPKKLRLRAQSYQEESSTGWSTAGLHLRTATLPVC